MFTVVLQQLHREKNQWRRDWTGFRTIEDDRRTVTKAGTRSWGNEVYIIEAKTATLYNCRL